MNKQTTTERRKIPGKPADARAAGWDAHRGGRVPTDNPFTQGTEQAQDWDAGYLDSQDDKRRPRQ